MRLEEASGQVDTVLNVFLGQNGVACGNSANDGQALVNQLR
jgi:hypothetical protein